VPHDAPRNARIHASASHRARSHGRGTLVHAQPPLSIVEDAWTTSLGRKRPRPKMGTVMADALHTSSPFDATTVLSLLPPSLISMRSFERRETSFKTAAEITRMVPQLAAAVKCADVQGLMRKTKN
jgi:hypothetical protein